MNSLQETLLAGLGAWLEGLPVRSLQAGLLALLIGLWHAVLRDRLSARTWSLLWGLVPLRLMLDSSLLSGRDPAQPSAAASWLWQEPLLELPADWVQLGSSASGSLSSTAWAWLWLSGVAILTGLSWRRARQGERQAQLHSTPAPRRLRSLLRREARRLGMARVPEIYLAASGPALVGLRKARIVVPRELLRPHRRPCLRAALRHELGHLQRRDAWRALIWRGLTLVFWFHPAQWWASLQVARLREVGCDQLAAGQRPRQRARYRAALLKLAGLRLRAAAGLSFLSPVEGLRQRLAHLAPERTRWRPVYQAALWLGTSALGWGTIAVTPAVLDADTISGPSPEVLAILNSPPGELEGCLQLRFATWAAMAQAQSSNSPQP